MYYNTRNTAGSTVDATLDTSGYKMTNVTNVTEPMGFTPMIRRLRFDERRWDIVVDGRHRHQNRLPIGVQTFKVALPAI